jgi:hypothetical protein
MGFEKVASDSQQINTLTGGITSSDGSPLLDTDSVTGKSTMFGPAAIREIQNGVANGDFGAPPQDATANINDTDNALPYWTFTDSSSGRVTLKVIDDATSGYSTSSGYILRASFANASATPDYARVERWVPILGGSNRPSAYNPEFTALFATNTATVQVQIYCQFYKEDKSTSVGTAYSRTVTGAQLYAAGATGVAGSVATISTLLYVEPNQVSSTSANWLRSVAPADAAYLRVLLDFQVPAAGPTADVRIDIAEVRLPFTQTDIILSDKEAPATYGPSHIWQQDGALWISGAQGFTNGNFPNTAGTLPDAGGAGIIGPMVLYSGNGGTGLFNEMAFISIGNDYWLGQDFDIVFNGEMFVPDGSIWFMNGGILVNEGGIVNTGNNTDFGGIAYRSGTFSLPNNAWTTVPLTAEYFDNSTLEGIFVDTTDDAAFPVGGSDINGMGWWVVNATAQFPPDADGWRGIRILKSDLGSPVTTGTVYAEHRFQPLNSGGGSAVTDVTTVTAVVYLNAGHDITDEWTGIRLQLFQNSGAAMTITPASWYSCTIQMARVGA